jgi:hypothetical protein
MLYLENKRFFADFVLFFGFLNQIFHQTSQFGVRQLYMAHSLCFLSPLAHSLLLPFLIPFTYLETLLAVTGSIHLGLRLLVN